MPRRDAEWYSSSVGMKFSLPCGPQARALCGALAAAHVVLQTGGPRTVAALAADLERQLEGPRGIDAVSGGRGDCARPRLPEIAAALNRLRTMQLGLPSAGGGGARAPPGL